MLGIDQGATHAEIDAAHRSAAAALQARPDAHAPDVLNRLKFLRIAQETLLHDGRRAAYDASLRKAAAPRPASLKQAPARLSRPLVLGVTGAVVAALALGWYTRTLPGQGGTGKAPAPDAAGVAVPAVAGLVVAAPAAALQAAAPALTAEALFERHAASVAVVIGLNGDARPILQGSGVVVADQRVVTNCHVAKAAAATQVKLGEQLYPAILLRVDPDPRHDLCLLAVNGLHAPAVPLADIGSVRVGQKVFALGAPKGLELTLSEGIVSSLREYGDSTFIQTTASISPGSSGGGLINERGELVGITTFQRNDGQNLNFAVPVDWVGKLLESKDSLAILGADALGDLLGKWRCDSSKGSEQMLYSFSRDGGFSMTRPESPKNAIEGSYAIMGNHTLVLKSAVSVPPEVYVQIMALDRSEMRLSSPFHQHEQTYQCRKTGT